MSKFKVVVCVELRDVQGHTLDSRDLEYDPQDSSDVSAAGGADVEEAIEEMLQEALEQERAERLSNILGALASAMEGTAISFPSMEDISTDDENGTAELTINTPDGDVGMRLKLRD